MKNLITVIIVFLFFSFCTRAQMSYGIKSGMNICSVKDTASAAFRYYGGGYAKYTINPKIAVQGDVNYSAQGYVLRDSAQGDVADDIRPKVTNLNYINIPIWMQCTVIAPLYVEFGPQISILTSAKYKRTVKSSIKNHFNSVDFSAGIGVGYFFKKINLGINSRYTCSLSPVFKGDDINFHNRVFQIGAFYKIAGKK
jgi:hypothetical protein